MLYLLLPFLLLLVSPFSLFFLSSFNLYFFNTIFLSFLISPLLPSPTFIILLVKVLNLLFEGLNIYIYLCPLFTFLQLQVICLKPLQTKHFLFCIAISLFLSLLPSYAFCCLHFFSIFLSSFILIYLTFLHSLSILFFFFASSLSCFLLCYSSSHLLL